MAVLELPIKETYVPKWGGWECVREIMQNGLDEHDNGHELTVEHKKGWLTVSNLGSDMDLKALLIGHTTKAEDGRARGQYGEGLDLSFLAGIRAGHKIEVETQREIWRPSIDFSKQYGENVLVVRTRKKRVRGSGVSVRMTLSDSDWEGFSRLFLSLRDFGSEDVIKTEHGDIILDADSVGMLYVKGIFVQRRSDIRHGYNFHRVDLDRDRRMVQDFDLKWQIAQMYSEAARSCPERVVQRVYRMMKDGAEDVRGFGDYNTSPEIREAMAEQFLTDFGDESVPVGSIGESKDVEHYGCRGVVVNDTLKKMLASSKVATPDEIKRKIGEKPVKEYSWGDLSGEEQANMNLACEDIDNALSMVRGDEDLCRQLGVSRGFAGNDIAVLDMVGVVDFHDEHILGRANMDDRVVKLSRSVVGNRSRLIRVLIHELGHICSLSSDGAAMQTHAVEELWEVVYHYLAEKGRV